MKEISTYDKLSNIYTARDLTNEIYDLTTNPENETKTIVIKFASSWFVFVSGGTIFEAYPLSTTKYKNFETAGDIFKFLKSKNIKEVHRFDGEVRYLEIRKAVNY